MRTMLSWYIVTSFVIYHYANVILIEPTGNPPPGPWPFAPSGVDGVLEFKKVTRYSYREDMEI